MTTNLDPPRWPNGPRICEKANLPAFETVAQVDAFYETNCPGHSIVARWRCRECGLIHCWGVGGTPSGASSGTTRIAKHIDSVMEQFEQSAVAKTILERV